MLSHDGTSPGKQLSCLPLLARQDCITTVESTSSLSYLKKSDAHLQLTKASSS